MNKRILVWDVESTGLPLWHEPSGGDNQPHLVQIAALLVDDNWRVIQGLDLIVQPDGWEIPQDVIDIHGITEEYAAAVGVPEELALRAFIALWEAADVRVAHNESFDARLIRIAAKRYISDEFADAWKAAPAECTGKLAKPIMGIKGRRIPKLSEAFEHFMGTPMDPAMAHTAHGDAVACMQVYRAIKEQEVDAEFEPEPKEQAEEAIQF